MPIRKHLLSASVALIFLVLALDYGGFPADATAAIAIGFWWILVVGLIIGLLPLERLGPVATGALLLLLGLAVLTTASTGWAPDQGRAFTKAVQFMALFGIFALVLFASRRGTARQWASGIVAGLTLIVLLAALGRFFPEIGNDTQLTRDLAGTEGRLSWPLGYWNAMGGLSAMSAVGLLWFAANGLSREVRSGSLTVFPVAILVLFLTSSRGGFVALAAGVTLAVALGPARRIMAMGLGVGILGGGILAYIATKMPALLKAEDVPQAGTDGLILFGVTVLVTSTAGICWFLLDRRIQAIGPFRPRAWKYALGVAALVALIVALNPLERIRDFSTLPQETTAAQETNTTTDHLLSTSGSGRAQVWEPAIEAFREEPLVGIGTGGFETYYLANRDVGWLAKHPHSLVFQVGAELGAVGLALLAGFLVLAIAAGWKKWRRGKAAASVRLASLAEGNENPSWGLIPLLGAVALAGSASIAVDWSAEFPVIAGAVLACLALVVGPATEEPSGAGSRSVRTMPERLVLAILIPVGLLAIWAGITSLGVETDLQDSRKAVSAGDLSEARRQAESAREALPMSAAPLVQLALIEELDGNYRAALDEIGEAIEKDPEKSSNYLVEARILLGLGREGAAEAAFEKARTLNPNDQIFLEPPPA